MAAIANAHGRKGGRGVRPWLLMPKVLAVAVYFGALVTATALAWLTDPATSDEYRQLGWVLRRIMLFVAVPALATAIVFGVLLFAQHRAVFWRMRWLRVKLAVLIVTLPPLHWTASVMVAHLRLHNPDGDSFPASAALDLARYTFTAASIIMAGVILLGRHKPRLGQRIAPVLPRAPEDAS